jgi:hypothetical protein
MRSDTTLPSQRQMVDSLRLIHPTLLPNLRIRAELTVSTASMRELTALKKESVHSTCQKNQKSSKDNRPNLKTCHFC